MQKKNKSKGRKRIMVVDAASTKGGFHSFYNVSHRIKGDPGREARAVEDFGGANLQNFNKITSGLMPESIMEDRLILAAHRTLKKIRKTRKEKR